VEENQSNKMCKRELKNRRRNYQPIEIKLGVSTKEVCRWLEEGVLKFTEEEAAAYLKFFVLPLYHKGDVTLKEVSRVIDTYARLKIINFKS
jgi:hypothetical protein